MTDPANVNNASGRTNVNNANGNTSVNNANGQADAEQTDIDINNAGGSISTCMEIKVRTQLWQNDESGFRVRNIADPFQVPGNPRI